MLHIVLFARGQKYSTWTRKNCDGYIHVRLQKGKHCHIYNLYRRWNKCVHRELLLSFNLYAESACNNLFSIIAPKGLSPWSS